MKCQKKTNNYTCIASITIDSVIRMEKKNYLQVYLEECKYKINKNKVNKFVEAELESDSRLEPEPESKSGTELLTKLEFGSDSQ